MPRLMCVIQARTGSTRLPRKVLRDLGGRPVLAWVVAAAAASGVCDEIAVATTTDPADDEIAALATTLGARVVRGPVDDVLTFAMRCPPYWRDSEDSQLCAAYSSDGGYSWQQVELAMHYHLPLITCAGIVKVEEGGSTRYLLPTHSFTARHDPHGTFDQFVLESTSMLEWKLAGYVTLPAAGNVFMHEGGIAAGDNAGELKMVCRTATADYSKALEPPIAYSTVSRDGGRTWSAGEPEPELHNATSKAYYGRAANGTQVYVYNVGARSERMGLGYKIKLAGQGQAWSTERVFYDANVHNSYPTLLEDEPGVFLCTWDSSTSADEQRTVIRFGRLVV